MVADPYRWLEDLGSADTAAWVAEQNRLTEAYLERQPIRSYFQRRIQDLWNFPKTELPVAEGGRIFYRMNAGLQLQSPLYMRDSLAAPPVLVIDPNVIWPDGTTSLAAFEPAPDAQHLAYAFARGGSDWQTIRVRRIDTGQDLADEIQWVRFSGIAWTKDARGFFYARYPEPPAGKVMEAALSGHALYYHALGTPQLQDRLIYTHTANPAWFVSGTLTADGRYLLVATSKGADNSNRLYVMDLGDPLRPALDAPRQPVLEEDGAELSPVGSQGSTLLLRTDRNAPNRCIVAIDATENTQGGDPFGWTTVVPESAHAIENATLAGGRLFVEYLVDVRSRLAMFDLTGAPLGDVPLPAAGSIAGISGREGSNLLFYTFTSHLYPATVFSHDIAAGTSTPFEAAPPPVDVTQYETTQMFAVSKDGTRVPFFMTARTGLQRDGSHPAMLYAYGGFAVSLMPG